VSNDQRVLDDIRESEHQRVRVAITDIDGVLRGKFMHRKKFLSAAQSGFGFCNVVFGWDAADVCYDDVDYTGWHSGYPDADAHIDLGTYRNIPWDHDVPFFLGEFVDENEDPLPVCPRQNLKKIIARAESQGYSPTFGVEFEWFNFQENPDTLYAKGHQGMHPLTPGMFGYSILRSSLNREFFRAIMEDLEAFGVPLEGLHTETGPGVYEAAILYSDALEAADRAVLFKTGVKEIAYDYGVIPTFMAKWNEELPGCSGHLHQSLWDADGEHNLFWDPEGRYNMSDLFESYLAGQLKLLPEFTAFYAPTVNSYKRLVEGLWAPTRVTWGKDNRTPALRVIPYSSKSTRVETRVTGSDINPYIAIAASLGSGLWGIEQGLKLEDAPIEGNAYAAKDAVRLPANLMEATERLRQSDVARELFGDAFVDHYADSREWEWQQFQQAVTSWELKRYFEII
jgi:glutamine synthetase